ncbi:MAG: PKD domain-containing protein [bacterium]|nr:PKD domain-containing protein [bacterium]
MRIHHFFLIAVILILVGCNGHSTPPVPPDNPQDPVAVAKAEPNPQSIYQPVSFSGSESYDPDGGEIPLFEWDWDNDGTFDETGENVDHTWTESGTFFVQLRVTDDEGVTDLLDDPLQVVISDAIGENPVAVATADPNPQTINLPVSFSGSGSYDPDGGEIQLFEWDWDNDDTFDETGENIDHTWTVPGTFFVQLRVTDDEGQVDMLDEPLQIMISGPSGGNLIWVKSAGGVELFDFGNGVATLSDNSTVVTGYFESSATFGLSEPNQTVLTSAGYKDVFIARYNPDGTLVWAKSAEGTDYNYGNGITALSDNSTVVTGCFLGTATFGPGEPNETVLTSAGYWDIFIARYNPDGALAWAKSAGGASGDSWDTECGFGITKLSDNSTVVTGSFCGSATFGPGEANQTVLTSAGGPDIFIARYNPDGTLAWAKRAGGGAANYDQGYGITTLSDNSTVVTGQFYGSATFGPGEPNQTDLTSAGGSDIFIARYNPDGTLAWVKRVGGASNWVDCGYGITTLSDNSTVVTGQFIGSATFGPGEPNQTVLTSYVDACDIFIARYNPDGTLALAKCAEGVARGFGITALSDNSTVVTGQFYDLTTFGPGEPNETVVNSGAYGPDAFIARYNPDGTLAWAKRAGGVTDVAFLDFEGGYGISTLSDDSTVVAGHFFETASFGPGEPNETVLTSVGGYDIFIARFAP